MCRVWCSGVPACTTAGAVHELGIDSATTINEARQVVDAWPDDMLIRDVYLHLQTVCAPVMLVDKVRMYDNACRLGQITAKDHCTRRLESATPLVPALTPLSQSAGPCPCVHVRKCAPRSRRGMPSTQIGRAHVRTPVTA